MKKNRLYFVIPVIIALICIIAFFKPLSLSDTVDEKNEIKMVYNELGIRDGVPYTDSTNYQTITAEQKRAILDLLGNYPYKRTWNTLFSDGTLSGLGDQMHSIYVYDDISLTATIFISSSGEIAINEKSYRMKNAEQFIEQIRKIAALEPEADKR